MRGAPQRILLALGWYDYRLHRGIEKYARKQRADPVQLGAEEWICGDHVLAEFTAA